MSNPYNPSYQAPGVSKAETDKILTQGTDDFYRQESSSQSQYAQSAYQPQDYRPPQFPQQYPQQQSQRQQPGANSQYGPADYASDPSPPPFYPATIPTQPETQYSANYQQPLVASPMESSSCCGGIFNVIKALFRTLFILLLPLGAAAGTVFLTGFVAHSDMSYQSWLGWMIPTLVFAVIWEVCVRCRLQRKRSCCQYGSCRGSCRTVLSIILSLSLLISGIIMLWWYGRYFWLKDGGIHWDMSPSQIPNIVKSSSADYLVSFNDELEFGGTVVAGNGVDIGMAPIFDSPPSSSSSSSSSSTSSANDTMTDSSADDDRVMLGVAYCPRTNAGPANSTFVWHVKCEGGKTDCGLLQTPFVKTCVRSHRETRCSPSCSGSGRHRSCHTSCTTTTVCDSYADCWRSELGGTVSACLGHAPQSAAYETYQKVVKQFPHTTPFVPHQSGPAIFTCLDNPEHELELTKNIGSVGLGLFSAYVAFSGGLTFTHFLRKTRQ